MTEIEQLHPELRSLVGAEIQGRYRVEEILGRGGMGAVFKGRHLALKRGVAIKVLRPEVGRDASMTARFTREAHSISRLDHPNCVRVSDFGTTEDDVRYLVMELLEGEELEASLGQPWPAAEAIEVTLQILDGLDHAHHCGVVHRDLKPENVFMTRDYRGETVVKIVDFGIAKLLDEQSESTPKLTREGVAFGTPRYMSPEQVTGGKLDARTDLYAVGLLLYEMLAGHPPFQSDEASALLRMHILAPPPELPPTVPPALAAVVMKLLEKRREDRPASARETIELLTQARASMAGAPGSAVGQAPAPAPSVQAPPAHAPPAPPAHAPPGPAGVSSGPVAHAPPAPAGAPSGPVAHTPPAPANAPAPHAPAAPPVLAPNQATQPGLQGWQSGATEPTQISQPVGVAPRRELPWRTWVAVAGTVMFMLMAFGAWQAVREDDGEGEGDGEAAPVAGPEADSPAASPTKALPRDDFSCADGRCTCVAGARCALDCPREGCELGCTKTRNCSLECGENCRASCIDAAESCAITLGEAGEASCEGSPGCAVTCEGSCEVHCPGGDCEVSCAGDRGRSAQRCEGSFVCGRGC